MNQEQKVVYEQGNELYRHYDAVAWTIAAIFVPISVGLLGASVTLSKDVPTPLRDYFVVSLAILSLAMFGGWFVLDRRVTFYNSVILVTLQELEIGLEPNIHRRIDHLDTCLRVRMKYVLWAWLFLIVVVWVARLCFLGISGY